MSENDIIRAAIEFAGSEEKLGKLAGVSQPAINRAKRAGRFSPALAVKIERGTSGKFPRWLTRPDLWDPPASTVTSEAAQ